MPAAKACWSASTCSPCARYQPAARVWISATSAGPSWKSSVRRISAKRWWYRYHAGFEPTRSMKRFWLTSSSSVPLQSVPVRASARSGVSLSTIEVWRRNRRCLLRLRLQGFLYQVVDGGGLVEERIHDPAALERQREQAQPGGPALGAREQRLEEPGLQFHRERGEKLPRFVLGEGEVRGTQSTSSPFARKTCIGRSGSWRVERTRRRWGEDERSNCSIPADTPVRGAL